MQRALKHHSLGVFHRLFSGYEQLLSIPHTKRFTFAVLLANMPGPMVGMAVTIGIQHYYHSYGLAGRLTGTQAIATAILGPLLGQLVDRFGQKRVAIPAACTWMCGAAAFVTCLLLHVPAPVFYVIMPLLAFMAPWGAMCRARWARILKGNGPAIDRSLAMCSIVDEVMWIIGNPLSSILAVWSVPGTFAFTAICVIIGATMFLGAIGEPPSQLDEARKAGMSLADYRQAEANRRRQVEAREEEDRLNGEKINSGINSSHRSTRRFAQSSRSAVVARKHDRQGTVLISAGMIALGATWFGLGAFQSATSISIIAFARELGIPRVTGLIFACFSLSSMIGVTFYGAHQWQIPLWKRFYFCLAVLVLGLGSFSLVTALWQVIVIYLLVGVCQGPTWVNGNQIVMRLVPTSRFTESVALMNAMNSVGSSVGSAVAGHFIDMYGAHGGFVTDAMLALGCLVIAFIGFRQIRGATAHAVVGEEKVTA